MALVLKNNAIGVDKVIDYIQKNVYGYLTDIGWTNYESYHRVYLNETNEGRTAEVYTSNNEYSEVLFNDNFTATSFFIVADTTLINQYTFEADIGLVFQVKINEIYDTDQREDEWVRDDVWQAIKSNAQIREHTNMVTGLSNVYAEIDRTQITWTDMHPCHVFRYNFKVRYTEDCRVRVTNDFLLLEDGGNLLLENGGNIIL